MQTCKCGETATWLDKCTGEYICGYLDCIVPYALNNASLDDYATFVCDNNQQQFKCFMLAQLDIVDLLADETNTLNTLLKQFAECYDGKFSAWYCERYFIKI